MRDILQQFNVESFQGYYYAKPLPLENVCNWGKDSAAPKEG
jgi:EAL domain-containing protein (putative c-di-GMP-specific phosphodiesterase class I)